MPHILKSRSVIVVGKIFLAAVALYVLFTLAAVIFAGGDEAHAAKPNRQQAETRLKDASARTGVAQTRRKAVEDQEALEPYVQEVIDAGGAKELVTEDQNPSVIADLQKLAPKLTTIKVKHTHSGRHGGMEPEEGEPNPSGEPPPGTATASASRHHRHPMASAAGCYGSVGNQWTYREAGQAVAWIYVRVNSWCGIPNSHIYWSGGPTYSNWHWGPFCLGAIGTAWSWDYYPRWIHTATWASQGVIYPWGCFTYNGGKAVIRFNASGGYDFYNDYGF